jgi:hypothetical protein
LAQKFCSDISFVGATAILTYETKGCDLREVTENDIDNDLRMFSTEAEKLMHSTLKDRVVACDGIHKLGVSWNYTRPVLSKECVASSR